MTLQTLASALAAWAVGAAVALTLASSLLACGSRPISPAPSPTSETATVSGQVFDSGGHCFNAGGCTWPMRDAVLHFDNAARSRHYSVGTGSVGTFSIALPLGTYKIWVPAEPSAAALPPLEPIEGPASIALRGSDSVVLRLVFPQRCPICQ